MTTTQDHKPDNHDNQPNTVPSFEGFLFDLDGTLLDTLPDLVEITNRALAEEGFAPHSAQTILGFVGNGAFSLISQATPDYADDAQTKRVYDRFRALYVEAGTRLTREFDGINATLHELKRQGKKLGIMSNKFEAGVLEVEAKFFPGLFDTAHGETDTILRKPEPIGLQVCMEELGLTPQQCIYFGDSHSDMMAAHDAGVYAAGVAWGYQPREKLEQGNPSIIIETPADILRFC